MHWVKIFLIVIGSGWFFPVSCTTGVAVGTQIVSVLDRRDVSRGDSIHPLFKVAAEPGEEGQPFRVLSNPDKESGNLSYRMTSSSASIEKDGSVFSYRVVQDSGNEQIIELIETYKDGDNTIWSRYKATNEKVTPLSSRMFYFGYMFTAFPFAVAFALLLSVSARIIHRIYFGSRDGPKN
jgi:hypothetical protein